MVEERPVDAPPAPSPPRAAPGRRWWLGYVLVGIACTGIGTCSDRPDVLTQIRALGELRVATRNAPTAYWQGVDGPDGPEYALAERFAAALGVPLKLTVHNSPTRLAEELSSGRVHLVAAGLAISPRWGSRFTWGPSYAESRQFLIVRPRQKRPAGVADLKGLKVEVVAGSAQADALRVAAAAGAPGQAPTWKEVPDAYVLDLLDRVSRGDLDATVADESEFRLARNFHPELTAAFELPSRARMAWLLPPNEPALAARVAAFFTALRPELPGFLARHYADPERLDYVGARNFIRHVTERLPRYRATFQEAAAKAGIDWRLLAAIGYQESKWDPDAVSPTGVRGLMMLQETTAAAMGVADRHNATQSIHGGARYFREVREMIPARIPEPDRTWLALASYNIGFGHLEDARILTQVHGRNPDVWQDVRTYLPLLTKESWFTRTKRGYARGYETMRFVDNVRAYLDILEWVAPDPNAEAAAAPEEARGTIKRPAGGARQRTPATARRTPPPAPPR